MAALLLDLRIAFVNLLEHRRRSSLLGAAIAMVTCLFVLLSALSAGIQRAMVDTATTLTTGHINIAGFFKVTPGQAAPILADYERVMDVARRSLPELVAVVPRGRGFGKIVSDDGSVVPALLEGIDVRLEPQLERVLTLEHGSVAQLAQPNTALLFAEQAKTLGVQVGDAITISAGTARGAANAIDCRVVAIAREAGTLSRMRAYVSADTLRALYRLRSDATGVLQLQLRPADSADPNPLVERLRAALTSAGYRLMEPDPRMYYLKLDASARDEWTGQKLDVTTWQEELAYLMWPLHVLRGLSGLLLLILLSIMAAGIMNTLWIAIRERTREIGTLRAIGMQRFGIARLFLFEAALLGSAAGTLGALLGAALIGLVNAARVPIPIAVQIFLMRDTLHFSLEPSTLLAGVGMVTSVTSLATLFPSVRAARRKPVEAMAHFG